MSQTSTSTSIRTTAPTPVQDEPVDTIVERYRADPKNQHNLIAALVVRDELLGMTHGLRIGDYHHTDEEYQSTVAADILDHLENASDAQVCGLLQGDLGVLHNFKPLGIAELEQVYHDLCSKADQGIIHDLRSFYQYLFRTYPDRIGPYEETIESDLAQLCA